TALEAPVLMAAGARLGVVQNPIIPLLRHREVGHITRQLGTRLILVPSSWRGFDAPAMTAELGLETWAAEMEGVPGPDLRLPAGDPSVLPPAPTGAEEFRWAYYSSGTTADPKGARHTDASVIASSNGMIDGLGFAEGDVYPIAWPFTHIGGM